jgi:hypothetical protein
MDYDATFIVAFTDELALGVRSLDFDTYEDAVRLALTARRACTIREVGYDSFSQTHVDRVRAIFTEKNENST